MPTWVGRADARRLRALSRRRSSTTSTPERLRPFLGARSSRSRTASSGKLTSARSSSCMIFARSRLRHQFARHGESPGTLEELEDVLDRRHPDDRLRPPLRHLQARRRCCSPTWTAWRGCCGTRSGPCRSSSPARPIRPTGRASASSRRSSRRSRSPQLRGRVFILEDYDMRVARFLVQGVDVWLNNPRRPLEASGTSGMKAAVNGVVNLSVLDGWWDEGWTGDNGWAIGGRETNPDEGAQDWADVAGSLSAPRAGGRAALLRPRVKTASREAWARDDAPLDRQHDLAVLDDADAPRIHRAAVPAGGWDRDRRTQASRRAATRETAAEPGIGRAQRSRSRS